MNSYEVLLSRIIERADQPAIYDRDRFYSYAELNQRIGYWTQKIRQDGIKAGAVVAVLGDFNFETSSLILALIFERAILVPLTHALGAEMPPLLKVAEAEYLYEFSAKGDYAGLKKMDVQVQNPLLTKFRIEKQPGLIVFTSGSTGKPKGILHNCERVIRKFVEPRQAWKTCLFLMMDHFGGFNTFISVFAYGGVAVCLRDRSPSSVCAAIQASKADLLPTTPTFLNLLITSGAYRGYDLSSIELITYGTEVMPEATLEKLKQFFPKAQVKQTYGLSELGVVRSKSEDRYSLWVKIGGSGIEVDIRDGILWIRSESNMVGYLNAPDPFDGEGWFCTGDQVETKGDYIRVLGRKSDMINVGGQKVFPNEVETVLLEAENVREASVYASKHSLMGSVVGARVALLNPENPEEAKNRLRKFCVSRLAKYKTPVKIDIVDIEELRSERFKKIRLNEK